MLTHRLHRLAVRSFPTRRTFLRYPARRLDHVDLASRRAERKALRSPADQATRCPGDARRSRAPDLGSATHVESADRVARLIEHAVQRGIRDNEIAERRWQGKRPDYGARDRIDHPPAGTENKPT